MHLLDFCPGRFLGRHSLEQPTQLDTQVVDYDFISLPACVSATLDMN